MAVTVEVETIDRTSLVQFSDGLSWTDALRSKGTASLTFRDFVGGFVPTEGQEVIVKDSAVAVFGGILTLDRLYFKGPDSAAQMTYYGVTIGGYEYLTDKRRVWAEYDRVDFADVITDLFGTTLNKLGGEGITVGTVDSGPPISVKFNGVTGTEALNQLVELAGDARGWEIVVGKVFNSEKYSSSVAPATLNAAAFFGSKVSGAQRVEVWDAKEEYVNQVTIRAGTDELPIFVTKSNATEITARIAAEGGTGIYHRLIEKKEILNEVDAESFADTFLADHDAIPKKCKGTVSIAGFAPGQSATVDLPNLGLSSAAMFVESVGVSLVGTALRYTLTLTSTAPTDGWQGFYRNPQPRQATVPYLLTPAPGILRVEPEPGLVGHEPDEEPADWNTGPASGTRDSTPQILGIMNRKQSGTGSGNFMLTVRRDTGPSPTETVLEKWWIAPDEQPATAAFTTFRWEEVGPSTAKTGIVVSPDDSLIAFIHYGTPGNLVVASIAGEGFMGSVNTTPSQQANPGEPLWIGDYIYWPDVSTGKLWIYDISSPTAPVEVGSFTTSLSNISDVVPSSDGLYLYATGGSGFVALDRSNPEVLVEDTFLTAGVGGPYISLDIDEADAILFAAVRADASNIDWVTINVSAGTLTLNTQGSSAVANSQMDGAGVLIFSGSAICFNTRDPNSVNELKAHVWNIEDPTAVTHVSTIAYTHPTGAGIGPARTRNGKRILYTYNNNAGAQITFGTPAYDEIKPLQIFNPAPVRFGGTGLQEYVRGNLIAASEQEVLSVIDPPTVSGAQLIADMDEPTLIRWAANSELNLVNIDNTDSPYTVPDGVTIILADATAGAVTVSPPAVADSLGRELWVKNIGDGTNAVTVDPNAAELIDTASSLALPNANDAAGFVADPNQWNILAQSTSGVAAIQLRGIDGLTTELAADVDHDVTIRPGVCTDPFTGSAEILELADPLTKQIDAAWAEGNDAGGMATGSVAADTEYNLILISKDSDGTLDLIFDMSPTGANGPTGWSSRRRIGSVFSDASSNIHPYRQFGDQFMFDAPIPDLSDTTGADDVFETVSLTVPGNTIALIALEGGVNPGLFFGVRLRAVGETSTPTRQTFLRNDDATSVRQQMRTPATFGVDGTSSLEYALDFSGTFQSVVIVTNGWIDDRGRNFQSSEEPIMLTVDFQELIENGSGVAKASIHASMNIDSAAFRFGSVLDRCYFSRKLPEAWNGVPCHIVGLFTHSHASLTGTGDDLIKLEVGFDFWDNDEALPNVGTINDATAAFEVDIDHEFPFAQYSTQALQLATFTPGAGDRHLICRVTRDGTEETGDGSRLATNLLAIHFYVIPVADDVGGFIVPDTVV